MGSRKRHRTIAQGLQFSDAKNIGKTPTVSYPTGAPNRGGVGSDRRFSTNIFAIAELRVYIYGVVVRVLLAAFSCLESVAAGKDARRRDGFVVLHSQAKTPKSACNPASPPDGPPSDDRYTSNDVCRSLVLIH